MRRMIIIISLLAIGVVVLAAATRPEPTRTALAQAVELLASDSPYRGSLPSRSRWNQKAISQTPLNAWCLRA